jgi:NAD(P)-dependent dehydrogenase (short-subunit alcohol dehydrogenase family)
MSAQRIALVSGASRGIGREIARQLVEEHGFLVLAGARDPRMVDLRASVVPLQLDVTELASIEAARRRFESDPGRLDVLIGEEGVDTAVWLAAAREVPTGKFLSDREAIPW